MAQRIIGEGKKPIIGMVHCLPLPKTANFSDNCDRIIEQAIGDGKNLEAAGCDAICIENMGDTPLKPMMDVPQIAALSAIAALLRREVSLPIGIDAAFNDFKASLSIAKILDAAFVRIPVFVDTVVYFGGTIQPAAAECMLYRKELCGEDIMIFADIQVKYTRMLLPEMTLEESARSAAACGADALIVTGKASGYQTPIESIEKIKRTVSVPVIAGSGVNAENIEAQMRIADGAVVGSSLKEGGCISNPIDISMARNLIAAYKG